MAAISIKCPTTGGLVSTGMTMEPVSFYRSILTGNSVKCPHCGATHIWTKAEAVIDGASVGVEPSGRLRRPLSHVLDPVGDAGNLTRRGDCSDR